MKITGKYFDDRIEKGSSIGSCRSPSRELQIERKTSGTLGDHCKLMIAQERYDGSPLQRSCLENPRDWGAWWAAISGVTQSWTRLKRLSSQKDIGTSWNKAGLLNYKAINKNMRYSQVIMWKKKNDICILLVEFSEIMILRTKDRNLRERWHSKAGDPHYMETWDDSTYFRIHYYLSANLHND